jgi:alpha-L-fucosidase
MKRICILLLIASCSLILNAKDLRQLQQAFVDLKFGMFIHFNIPTFTNHDWPDPDADPALFNPRRLDCTQWADAAKSAGMRYGCLTAKHHSGFCIWNTATTNYGVISSPFRRDVVREFADAFRNEGLRVMLYFSILDTHHKLRPGYITREHIALVKNQLTELLTNYGEIDAIVIDGWDAPWARISYDEIPFEEIYRMVKKLQPNCLLMDLNAAKYPAEALLYTDIKSYEQGAGQHIQKETNQLPALSCLPLNRNWFWKESFPVADVKNPEWLVKENLEPLNDACCNFILNVAPNHDGLIDNNALEALREIGQRWNANRPSPRLADCEPPIVSENIARHQPANSSWSDDMMIMDFGNDDNYETSWESNPEVGTPWFEIDFPYYRSFNAITIYDTRQCIQSYRLLYEKNGVWETLASANDSGKMKIHRFPRVWGGKVKIIIDESTAPPAIAELGVYDEQR